MCSVLDVSAPGLEASGRASASGLSTWWSALRATLARSDSASSRRSWTSLGARKPFLFVLCCLLQLRLYSCLKLLSFEHGNLKPNKRGVALLGGRCKNKSPICDSGGPWRASRSAAPRPPWSRRSPPACIYIYIYIYMYIYIYIYYNNNAT